MNSGGHSLKVAVTIFTKAAGTNFDHFSENFPHGRVDFV